jgi:hypothetical protein
MFYSHEGELHWSDSSSNRKVNDRSSNVAQIRCGDCVVSKEGAHLLLPNADRTGRLVATLGSKSSLKRINRKQILDVDVSKACQTIVDPVAPMALRLQGNLLYVTSPVARSEAVLTRSGTVYRVCTCSSADTFSRTRRMRTTLCG